MRHRNDLFTFSYAKERRSVRAFALCFGLAAALIAAPAARADEGDATLTASEMSISQAGSGTLNIAISSETAVQSIGFKITVPTAIGVGTKADGTPAFTLPASNTHTLFASSLGAGAYRVAIVQNGGTLSGSDVALLSIPLTFPADLPSGVYTVMLSDIELSGSSSATAPIGIVASEPTAQSTITATINGPVNGIATVETEAATVRTIVNAAGQTLSAPQHGINIIVRTDGTAEKVIR